MGRVLPVPRIQRDCNGPGALKLDINQLIGSRSGIQNEKGLEVFYDFAITPALRIIPSYQHIWNPLTAEVAAHERRADVLLVRFAVIL